MFALVKEPPAAVLPLEVTPLVPPDPDPPDSLRDQGSGSHDDTLAVQPSSNPRMQ